MFGIFFKASWRALPWIFIVPLGVFAFYLFIVWPYIENSGIYEQYGTVVFTHKIFLISVIVSIVINLVFLMIIPCAIGGANAVVKRTQFYIGFFVNLALTLFFPILWGTLFAVDIRTDSIQVAMHLAAFGMPYILGALFVAPAYARAFWFVNRK